ncbi:MAG: helix-turn-helix domain-containing protein [Telmatospirillum sp.]|nr:helix-turn-helix domain-containing protein [Telmatospirillum sp.]
MARYLSSREAANLLRISRQTLYAYVSRGLLTAHPADDPRESRYLAEDVDHLAAVRSRGRKPKDIARATLDWGLPVLESALTLISGGQLFYRGRPAAALADSATAEEVAALLWQVPEDEAFGPAPPVSSLPAEVVRKFANRRAEETLLPLFTLCCEDAATAAWQNSPGRLAAGCGGLVRLMASCLLGTLPSMLPLHRQCALAWEIDAEGADLIRRALVLIADHELNASSFTARCVVSTGASLRAALIGALAALTGGRHGGTTARGEAFWDEVEARGDIGAALRERLARGDSLPGFGHPLYPGGDIRACLLLDRILPAHPGWQTFIDEAYGLLGQRPSVDFALVALRRHLGLPVGSAFGLFALGRSVGWIAHALEQREQPGLIRPRATYVGPGPENDKPVTRDIDSFE